MSSSYTIALDVMGGDYGVPVVLPAARQALKGKGDFRLQLVGDQAVIEPELEDWNAAERERVEIVHASQVVGMEELPAVALRTKRDSSMRVAIDQVRKGEAQACVSAGNTGGLMATARYVLKTLPGIDRPAIATALPSMNAHTHMLDLGANVDVEAEHLYQFAVMGSVLAKAVDGLDSPRVGLLNIGSEAIKGNDRVREAGRMLEESSLNYVGFVEGNDVYCGDVDVVVCDGFVGNVALKTSEGVAKMITSNMKAEFRSSLYSRLAGLMALPVLRRLRQRFDHRRYNGASLLGLQGIVIKSHGSADSLAFANAIRIARIEAEANIATRIDKQLERLLRQETPE
ncbi:phosphate acyltransferase PlsX [Thioalkalivibrio halophilus]|uniref:Phosphate acyltransferase n=1 Tax=Thioalkalivibrio halophilus TaxID=252474 RepID=A0A1V3A0R1_9GAMM|nr:phosphate acyltransferase PlsX [Thioalkalivibrio halophilus]OOC10899.1 phosphate acyltransferase [Thioalkalivibrio halophilus]